MTWIKSVPPEEATGPLKALYARIAERSPNGRVSALWQACGLDPAPLEGRFAHYSGIMDDPTPLTRAQAEMVAVVVSATNGCGYMVAQAGPRLAAALGDEALARAIALDYREANIAARDRVLLDYAVALSCEPGERTQADVERLREYGFDDKAILRLTGMAGLICAVNRVATGLGVPLEPDMTPWEFGAQK